AGGGGRVAEARAVRPRRRGRHPAGLRGGGLRQGIDARAARERRAAARGDRAEEETIVSELRQTIDAVWRIESPRIIGALVRLVRDVALAEDLAHEALVAALETWPDAGVPDKPGAWLTATAKNRALDHLRRNQMLARKHDSLDQPTST